MKRIFNLKYVLAIIVILVTITSCQKKIGDFGNINNDPGAPTDPNPAALLSNVTSGLGNWVYDGNYYRNTSVPGMYCQYFSQTQYTEESRYQAVNYNWTVYYAGSSNATGLARTNLMDLQTIINFNTDEKTKEEGAKYGSNNNQIAVARILKGYLFWIITDQYGDIPYEGTLQGEPDIPYQAQKDVYADIMKELKEAIAQFDDGDMPAGDLLFNGDKSKWKKFANSVRLLMALRMSKADATTGKTEFNAALSDGVIEDNADNAVINYPGGSFNNPFYEYYNIIQRKDISPTEFLVNMLKANNDERLSAFASTDVGFPYGLTRADAVNWSDAHSNWAFIMSADYYNDPTSPMYLITASDIWLARAEAASLGWTTDVAATAYSNGIEDSWKQWNIYDATKFTAYMLQPAIVLAGTPEEIKEKIATQRWLAFYPDGKQGWAVWRKTGYPKLTPAPGTNTGIPQRYPYGTDESTLNTDNYNAAAKNYSAGGADNSQFAKLWWAK